MKSSVFFLLTSMVLLASSCGGNSGSDVPVPDVLCKADSVFVRTDSPVFANIRLEKVALQPFSTELRTVGTASAEAGRFAEVVIPFDGRITRSFVSLGQKVKAGQPLFEIFSPDFNETVKAYLQAQHNFEKSKADYQRKQSLYDHGVISKLDLEEVFTEEMNLQHDLESARANLEVFHIDLRNLKVGQPVSICAPIAGEVVSNNIVVGQYFKADSDSPVAIADLGKIWVTALVKERYIGNVSTNGQAEVFVEGDHSSVIDAKILNVGSVVDPDTRSVQVVLGCDNADRRIKHGMFVSVHFMSEPYQSIVLPASAIFQGEQSSFVFVSAGRPGEYVKRQVVLGPGNDDNTRISVVSGLNVGDEVIVEGGLYLNE